MTQMCWINFWRKKERRRRIIIRNGANTISLQTSFGDLITMHDIHKYIKELGMLSTKSRCADYFWNFQNGHRQNAKKLKNTKMIIAGYSPNRNWSNFMKIDERNPKNILIPPFLFQWQLQQSFSNRFRFFWLISFN
jgi:hypothetical protein